MDNPIALLPGVAVRAGTLALFILTVTAAAWSLRVGVPKRWIALAILLTLWGVYRCDLSFALVSAVNDMKPPQVEELLDRGASPNAWDPHDLEPATVLAARYPRSGFLKLLLDRGADLGPFALADGHRVLEEAIADGYGYPELQAELRSADRPAARVRRALVLLLDLVPFAALVCLVGSCFRRSVRRWLKRG